MTERERMKDSHVIEFNREAEVQMEGEKKTNMLYRQIECGMLTRNEARSLMNMPKISDEEQGGDDYYHPANWLVAGEEPDTDEPTGVDPMVDPADPEDPAEDPEEPMTDKSRTLLKAMITSSVTSAIKLESAKMIQRAGIQADKFPAAVIEFYQTWTENTVPGLSDSACRVAVIWHAEASKKLLMDVHSVSTSDSLKANVSDVVASWDSRAENLISSLMKAVE
jgi:hypothetical protein